METKVVRVQITAELLLSILQPFPEGTRLLRVREAETVIFSDPVTELLLSHPDLPDAEEGKVIPLASPSWGKDEEGEVSFLGWGIGSRAAYRRGRHDTS